MLINYLSDAEFFSVEEKKAQMYIGQFWWWGQFGLCLGHPGGQFGGSGGGVTWGPCIPWVMYNGSQMLTVPFSVKPYVSECSRIGETLRFSMLMSTVGSLRVQSLG